ncbi:50S ribosomal protein L4, partial [Candidatus Kaiserbacteria bacterium]|nr:50S ribosomal protein L4 [Candidatus Kaiserbacteria bacterium]
VPKTADAKKALLALSGVKGFERLSTKRVNAGLVALSQKNEAVEKSFRNIGSITATDVRSLNPVAVLKATYILIENPAESLALVESRMNKKA